MKLHNIKFLLLFLAAALVLNLSGCGSTGGMNEPEGGDDSGIIVTPASMTLSADNTELFADGASSTQIRAVVQDSNGLPFNKKLTINFYTPMGMLSAASAETVNGAATVTLTSPIAVGSAVVRAVSGSLSSNITINFNAVPKNFSLSSTQNTVKSDSSDTAIITATLLDTNYAPIPNINVIFSATGGQINKASSVTDENGNAQVTFSSGKVNQKNQTVNITASVAGFASRTIPIQVIGTEVTLITDITSLRVEDGNPGTLTVLLQDAGTNPIFSGEVTATIIPGVPGDPEIEAGGATLSAVDDITNVSVNGVLEGRTNVRGEFKIYVTGTKSGQITVSVNAGGDTKSQTYSISSSSDNFAIIAPDKSLWGLYTDQELDVVVRSPSGAPVQFSTTFGTWENEKQIIEKNVGPDGTASAKLKSSQAGVASIQVVDTGDPLHLSTDSFKVAISAPSDTAASLALQASPSVISPSVGDSVNISIITATVRNADGQVVGNAPIAFSISETTGGGESLSPVIAYTNAFGVASTTFSSGSLSSSGMGVKVSGIVLVNDQSIKDDIYIKIGGTAGSVIIGRGSAAESSSDGTSYSMPMSVMVSDSNGNPVTGAKVSLGVWPVKYRTGYWVKTEEGCAPYISGEFDNEDINRNLTLDPGEDMNGDGTLTPPNSAGGVVVRTDNDSNASDPSYILTTGKDGIAPFNLVYLKGSAIWIDDEITAMTKVAGSETQSTYKLMLPYVEGEECNLPSSPYKESAEGELVLKADPASIMADGITTSTITATVKDTNGNLVPDGLRINFTIQEGGGSLSAASAATVKGKVSVTYTSSEEVETIIIRAEREDKKSAATIQIPLTAGVASLSLVSADSEIRVNGGSTSITATAKDSNGSPVAKDTVFSFETNHGIFSNGEKTFTVRTPNDQGTFTVAFMSEGKAARATIKCTVGGVTQSTTVLIGTASEISPPAEITLKADKEELPPNGTSYTAIQADVKDAEDNPVIDGEIIQFVIEGTNGGSFDQDRPLTVITGTTVGGLVNINYYTPAKDVNDETGEVITIRAKAGDAEQGTATITLKEGAIVLVATPSSLVADGSSTSTVVATVKDFEGKVAPDGERILFIASHGTFGTLSTTSGTTAGGVVSVQYTAPPQIPADDPETDAKEPTISASAFGYTASNVLEINLTVQGLGLITMDAESIELPADGIASTVITIKATSNTGGPMVKGTEVALKTNNGFFADGKKTTTVKLGENGTIQVPFKSESLDNGAIATITATITVGADILTQQETIELIGLPKITGITLTTNNESIPADGKSKAVITATVSPAAGEPPDGIPVIFKIKSGTASWAAAADDTTTEITSSTTDGIATATLVSSTTAKPVTIRAEAKDYSDEIIIQLTEGGITLEAVPSTVLGTGLKEVKITATVTGTDGTVVKDAKILFSLVDQKYGILTPSSDVTKESGIAETTFKAGTIGGTATIKAVWDGKTVSSNIDIIIQPPPAFISVAEGFPTPTSISIKGTGGQTTSQIVMDVKDISGNPVVDGYRIDFLITDGPNGGEGIDPPFAVTSGGQVSTILRSGFKSGPVSIKASYHENTNVNTTTSQIAIQNGPPVGEEFGISVQYKNISGLKITGLEDVLTVDVGDFAGNPVPDGTAISFKTYNTGGILTPGSASTGGTEDEPLNQGFAKSALFSAASPIPAQGFVSVTAEAVNGGRTTHVTSIAVVKETANTQILYAGTDGGGVYKSSDSGTSWQNISRSSSIQGQNWIDPYINDIDVDPDDLNKVYTATGFLGKGNLFRSLDGGMNWNSNNVEEWNGVFDTNVSVLTVLCDDNGSDYVWIGTDGDGAYYSLNGEDFTRSKVLTSGKRVYDIVKVEGTNGGSAQLYAGTAAGLYKSTDGGKNWTAKKRFLGDYITTLAIYPKSASGGNDVIYAGTEGAGVWVSTDGGGSWTNHTSGMGKGLSATPPLASDRNEGTGTMSSVTVLPECQTENWTVTFNKTDNSFDVKGSVSGLLPSQYSMADITAGKEYVIPNVLKFTISPGNVDFSGVLPDVFTFKTTKDPGRKIEDVMVDPKNHRLYAITYFMGENEPHPVGNLYVHDLDIDGSMPLGDWKEANKNLPKFDPPDDVTLFAQHALALNDKENPTAMFIGGEGINFYKASNGLDTGNPVWQESKTGLTNLVMARMPVLFTGDIALKIYTAGSSDAPDVFYSDGTRVPDNSRVIYVEDANGNPPIVGCSFVAQFIPEEGDTITYYSIDYPDTLSHRGTCADPLDRFTGKGTDMPYIIEPFTYTYEDEDGILRTIIVTANKIEFTAVCGNTSPGCSGASQCVGSKCGG
ncbi:Invasin domain-containing protein [Desulfonema limicola]|uniref:Invasin domain-containing protein n=1 Tax=Desulfonema limicola TaxID=45656 RepID=A0A975BE71_9BACT|nr:invasin domain 3-containing protein [Desulfonema limicola]QTA83645.1 Invasin domain-containing protein [Desulfonema limicola]